MRGVQACSNGKEFMKSPLEILQSIRPEADFSSSQDFLGDGLLDSFDLVALTSELDSNFGISILGTDITPENFTSLSALTALLRRYGAPV